MRDKYKNSTSYPDLLQTIAQIADSKNREGAYAELAAYDVMNKDFLLGLIELNKTLPASDSFAGEMGGKETNEDGYIDEYNVYFDVKILADTVSGILRGIIDDAIAQSSQQSVCNILPEYPLDDDEFDYKTNRRMLMEELKDFLSANKPINNKGKAHLRISILPRLSYRGQWGAGVNSSTAEYDAYRHAEECRYLIFKRYTKKLMKGNPFFLVDEVFYRSLSRRTFCEYKNLSDSMSSIVSKFKGPETVFEVSNCLSGLIL